MVSAASSQPRLQTQNLAADVSARRSATSRGCSLSNARAQAQAQCGGGFGLQGQVCEHAAHQRLIDQGGSENPSMMRMCRAWTTAWRIIPALPVQQSRRVKVPISRIVGTPRPSSPRSEAHASMNSTSEEALERLPSLSFSR